MTEKEIMAQVSPEKRPKYCQFWQGDEKRWCQATTMPSCIGCKFFCPTYNDRVKIMVDYINARNRESLKLAKNLAEARDVIAWLRRCMKAENQEEQKC